MIVRTVESAGCTVLVHKCGGPLFATFYRGGEFVRESDWADTERAMIEGVIDSVARMRWGVADVDTGSGLMGYHAPMPGDVVRLTGGRWLGTCVKPGGLGMIGGVVGQARAAYEVTFNFSAFRGKSSKYSTGPEFISCSGGPGTIATPAVRLVPTGETARVRCWRWKGLPEQDGGEDYLITVPVWEWDGVDGAA